MTTKILCIFGTSACSMKILFRFENDSINSAVNLVGRLTVILVCLLHFLEVIACTAKNLSQIFMF